MYQIGLNPIHGYRNQCVFPKGGSFNTRRFSHKTCISFERWQLWHLVHNMNTSSAGPGCIRDEKLVITVPHYNDVIMSEMASQTTSLMIVYSTVYSGADQRKHQSSASLAFVRGIHQWLVNSPHKWPVTRKMFSFDDVIMYRHPGT